MAAYGVGTVTMGQGSTTPVETTTARPEWSGTARYEILGSLGKGGMGVVYEAFDRERRQLVALKTLLHFDAAALYLFKQEFRTVADLHHTNLVHLYELEATEAGQVFFTMELLRGQDFRQYVTRWDPRISPRNASSDANARTLHEERDTVRPGPPPRASSKASIRARSPADFDRLRAALRQLVEGVHALHSAGKVHRDIKPSNVLVTHEGRVVLLDFGVATEVSKRGAEPATGTGEVVGTARYMAPETADDAAPSPASDWYSVGVMLYEALVGRPPFVGSLVDVLTAKSLMDPPPPAECCEGVPPELDALCRSLLDRDPARRPTGAEILGRLGVTRSSAPPPSNFASSDSAVAFIGRQGQLDALRRAFDVVVSGGAMTVRVGGAPGMGKSTLVNGFLDHLAIEAQAVVLRGRVYEREAVPYKAVDSIVDALSRHLMHLAEADDALELPADAWALARVFPVLQRVPGIGPSDEAVADPQGLRRRAFEALRSLLTSLGRRHPLVIFIDDAEWGDLDSAALLLELLRPPEAPPLLLLMTYRDSEAGSSPLLTELREHWPEGAGVSDIDVGPLDHEDAMKLALALLDAQDPLTERTARAVARESRGSPFLIEELVRSNRGVAATTGATLAVLTLDQMVSQRLERLPDAARRLIEVVAVGGRPLPLPVLAEAAGVPDSINELVTFLGAKRLARTGLREGRDVVEACNGRIGETIVALLPAATLREHHRSLARVLEDAGGSDAEAVAMHWLGAGENDRSARFAERAAEHAATKLAFDRAARLFRLTLEIVPASSPEVPRLRVRLAQALQFAGRPADSAHAYLAAVDGAPAAQRVEFRRAAAEQLISAGRINEGAEMLHGVLAAAGMSGPRSPLAAVFWLVVYRFWLGFLALRFEERTPAEVTPENRLRVDALHTAASGFAVIDVIVGACMQARHLIEALRVGDRFQVVRAIGVEAAQSASTGGPQGKRELALVETGSRLADREGTVEAHTYFDGAWGIGLFQRGRWAEARSFLERGQEQPMLGNAGLASIRLFAVYTGAYLGDMKETARRMRRLCADAEDRGDRYTTVNLRTSLGITTALAFDDPEAARRQCALGLSQWTQSGFHVQHWQSMIYGSDIEVYAGNGGRGYERFMKDMPALKRSLLLHAGFVRAVTFQAQARFAISSIESHPELRQRRIAEARSMARRLAGERSAWTTALSSMATAMAENAAGDRVAAIAALRRAADQLDATGTAIYGSIVRYRLAETCPGDEGKALMARALAALAAQGIRNPPRWAAVYMPGRWDPSD